MATEYSVNLTLGLSVTSSNYLLLGLFNFYSRQYSTTVAKNDIFGRYIENRTYCFLSTSSSNKYSASGFQLIT